MKEFEFNDHASSYDAQMSDAIPAGVNEADYFARYKVAVVAQKFGRVAPPLRILDFGCGIGKSLRHFSEYFPGSALVGYDPSDKSVAAAAIDFPDVTFTSDWSEIEPLSFDIIFSANVFHHIDPLFHEGALKRCADALNRNGRIFLFEHNPLNPATRWVFDRCAFDVGAKMVSRHQMLATGNKASLSCVSSAYTLFFPRPLAWLRRTERFLGKIPLGAQYYVEFVKRG